MTSQLERTTAGEWRFVGIGCPKHGLGKTLKGVMGKFTKDLVRKFPAEMVYLFEHYRAAVRAGQVDVGGYSEVGGYHNVVVYLGDLYREPLLLECK